MSRSALIIGCLLLAPLLAPAAEAQKKSGFAGLIEKVKNFAKGSENELPSTSGLTKDVTPPPLTIRDEPVRKASHATESTAPRKSKRVTIHSGTFTLSKQSHSKNKKAKRATSRSLALPQASNYGTDPYQSGRPAVDSGYSTPAKVSSPRKTKSAKPAASSSYSSSYSSAEKLAPASPTVKPNTTPSPYGKPVSGATRGAVTHYNTGSTRSKTVPSPHAKDRATFSHIERALSNPQTGTLTGTAVGTQVGSTGTSDASASQRVPAQHVWTPTAKKAKASHAWKSVPGTSHPVVRPRLVATTATKVTKKATKATPTNAKATPTRYPYYTTRGPRDFLAASPPTTGTSPKLSTACEHILIAARHLEEAGLKDQAQKLRTQARKLYATELLKHKKEMLKKLEAEIKALQEITGSAPGKQVMLNVRIIDFEAEKMRKAGFDFRTTPSVSPKAVSLKRKVSGHPNGPGWSKIVTEQVASGLFDALVKNRLAQVVAEPRMVTVSGRSVSFFSGAEFPIVVPQGKGQVSIEFLPLGVKVKAVPIIRDKGRVTIEISPEVSRKDAKNGVEISGTKVPGYQVTRMDLQGDLELGQTILMGGMRLGDRELMMSVTPTIVR